ncbi:MAG: alpha/beta fold hydrolase [Xanthobacteraceae bacterium]
MKIKANGITINYQVDGPDNAPCLVFSNSLATTIAMWDEQASTLKNKFRVLRYDQRGHGETEAPAGRYAFDTLLADALGLLDALSIKKAHFAGLSMGGATALGLAEKHPDRFDRIIVCDSRCQSTPQSSQQWEERIVIAKDKGTEALIEPTIARWFPPETVAKNPPHLDKVRGMIRNTPANGFIGCAAALLCIGCRCGEASGSVHGGRERRRDACRHAQAQRKASGLAFCRTAWRRSHLQYGPAGGIHPRHYRLLELSAKYRLSVK